jgi:hypothetical protein
MQNAEPSVAVLPGWPAEIQCAADAIHEPFGIINADDFYGAQSFQLLAAHLQPDNPSYAMVGFVLRNTLSEFGSVARGVCQLTDYRLDSIREIVGIEKNGSAARFKNGTGEFHALVGDEMVSMNMWGFNPGIFDHLRRQFLEFLKVRGADEKAEFYIPNAVNTLIRTKKIRWMCCRHVRPGLVSLIAKTVHLQSKASTSSSAMANISKGFGYELGT